MPQALEPDLDVEFFPAARVLIVAKPGIERPAGGGVVGLLSAGTSDVPVASEASFMAAEMGARTLEAWDVGIAGLHRLIEPLEWFVREDVDAIVVRSRDGWSPAGRCGGTCQRAGHWAADLGWLRRRRGGDRRTDDDAG